MNNETLNRLNAFIADYKKESEEKDAIIKQQNQTLLHISAELEAVKQYDPLDLVLIAGSIENISAIIRGRTEPIIDEECVGCCRVQCDTELIERLSTEIHNRDKTIEELKDKNIEDLHELYDLYEKELGRPKHVISARDLTIKSLTVMCQSSGSIRNDLTSTIEDQKRTIDHFINYIGGLEAELTEKQEIIDKITLLRVNEVETLYNLKAELPTRKDDSAVLMKVVDAIRAMTEDARTCPQIDHLSLIVKDYLDAPEGPPETPIDDLYKVTVTYAFLEMP